MADIKELIALIKNNPEPDQAVEILLARLEELDQTHSLISTRVLIELERDESQLTAYQHGGIDNWEWQYDSLKDHYVEPYPDEPGAREYD